MNWKECGLKWSKAGIRYYPRVILAGTEANHDNPWYRLSQSPTRHSNVPNTQLKGSGTYRLKKKRNKKLALTESCSPEGTELLGSPCPSNEYIRTAKTYWQNNGQDRRGNISAEDDAIYHTKRRQHQYVSCTE
jgi:hypothetical protein